MIGWVILLLALGDLVILALLLKERRAHGKSRTALKFWRDRAGLTQVDLRGKGDVEALRAVLPSKPTFPPNRVITEGRDQQEAHPKPPARDRIRLAHPGGAA